MDEKFYVILADLRERIVGLETKLETMGDTSNKASQAILEISALKERVDKLEKIVFWASTTIIGTIIMSTMTVILL